MTPTILLVSQLIIAFGIYNVWLLRPQKQTAWRGGDAKNMEEEFHVYGLSTTCMKIVRVCKLSCATALLIGFFYKPFAVAGATGMALLMLAAVVMHAKVRDPIKKSLPAASLLVLSLIVACS
jgi:hypothetical protein